VTTVVHPELAELLARQPYTVNLDGLVLEVHEDVFPPDLGRCARNMARLCARYAPTAALDVGCGSGYLALSMKRDGAAEVWASDIHPAAVECARRNVRRNAGVGPVQVVESDLFAALPRHLRFDLVTFHQPYAPSDGDEGLCGCGPDGGYGVTRRFLLAAPEFVAPGGAIMMAFSDRAAAVNDPKRIANELGYRVRTLLDEVYSASRNWIYELSPATR
jgi:release factor glutamine methyltransferase